MDSSDLTGRGTVSDGTSSLADGVVGVFGGGGVSLSCDTLTFGRIACCTGLSVSLEQEREGEKEVSILHLNVCGCQNCQIC